MDAKKALRKYNWKNMHLVSIEIIITGLTIEPDPLLASVYPELF